jgi:hypothetical protein
MDTEKKEKMTIKHGFSFKCKRMKHELIIKKKKERDRERKR